MDDRPESRLMETRLSIALELAKHNPTYEDIASKVSTSGSWLSFGWSG